jgi:hypothetical protein
MRLLSPAAAMVLFAGCGYVGDPMPPALNIPQPVTDLQARQTGNRIVIRFTAPRATTDGLTLHRLSGIDVRIGTDAPATGETLDAGAAQPGPVELATPASPWTGQRIRVAVRAASLQQRWSEWTTVEISVVQAPMPPQNVRAESHPRGVRLRWTAGPGQVQVWKRPAGRQVFLEAAEVEGNEWLDTQARYGELQEYQLQTVVLVDDSTAESERTGIIAIAPQDSFPPSVPAALTVVTGIDAIELVWERSPEPDTDGYHVYRADGSAEFTRLAERVRSANFSDRAVKSGSAYRYAVSAVDSRGNESARSKVIEITLR